MGLSGTVCTPVSPQQNSCSQPPQALLDRAVLGTKLNILFSSGDSLSQREENLCLGLHTPVAFGADPQGFSVERWLQEEGRNAFLIMCCSLSALAA